MNHLSFVATGDSFITRNLSAQQMEPFQRLSKLIQSADFRFTNLETTIHHQEGYPAAFSGGTWAMSSPHVLEDLKTFGFNVMAWANNHTLDYSHGGLLATKRYLDEAGIVHAGAGENLAEASAPKYVDVNNKRIALISVTSTFHESGIAGDQRPDMIGRPGVNPLRFQTTYVIPEKEMELLRTIAKNTHMNAMRESKIKEGFIRAEEGDLFYFGNKRFVVGSESKKVTSANEQDLRRLKQRIKEARRQSDAVIVSIHSHEMDGDDKAIPARFLEEAARACIDEGADAIVGHGPHVLRGIEVYKGKPIFYSLGNFIFQNDSVAALPADFYERYGLDHYATIADAIDQRSSNDTRGFAMNKHFWESVIAVWDMEGNETAKIKLYPIELGFGKQRHERGWPTLQKDVTVLQHLQNLSEPYGTSIDIQDGIGTIYM